MVASETKEDLELLSSKRIKLDNDTSAEQAGEDALSIDNTATTSLCIAATPTSTNVNSLSKNQQKKLRKKQIYELRKLENRKKERERAKEKRQKAVKEGLPARIGPTRKELKHREIERLDKEPSLRIAIDLDFDEQMNEHDLAKCVQQCLRIYTINRRSSTPTQLHFTGIKRDGNVHKAMERNDGWLNWQIHKHFDATHLQVFDPQQLVYLTCESDNILNQIDASHVYIIGGLVDHNHHKGLCHERAISSGIKTARLPLKENVDMKTRSVLSTYHVFEILLRVAEGNSWMDAILSTLPLRKGAKAKEAEEMQTEITT